MGPVATKLTALEHLEHRAVSHFNRASIQAPTERDRQKDALRQLFLAEPNGGTYKEFDHYGWFVSGVPILRMLMTQPRMFIDIPTRFPGSPAVRRDQYSDAFQKYFGVSIPQFCTLAEHGFVIPNIIEYASQKASHFAAYDNYPELIRVFDASTHCRINKIRRLKFFESYFGKTTCDSYISEGADLLRRKFHDELRLGAKIGGGQSVEAVITRLARNWVYVKVLGDDTRRAIADQVITQPSIQAIPQLVALATSVSWDTSGFAGRPNISISAMQQIFQLQITAVTAESNAPMLYDEEHGEFGAALVELTRRSLATHYKDVDLRISFDMQPEHFRSLVRFLEDHRSLIEEADDRFADIGVLTGQQKFTAAHQYLSALEEWHKQLHYWSDGTGKWLLGGAAGAMAGAASVAIPSRRAVLRFFGAGIAIAASAAANAFGMVSSDAIVKMLLSEEEIRVVQWYDRWTG